MKKTITLIILVFILIYPLIGQNVTNLDFYLQDEKIIVTYDLDKDADVYLFASINEADGWNTAFMNWSAYLKEAPALRAVTGDVGRSVQKGSGRRIVWNLGNETLSWFPKNEDGIGKFIVYDDQKKKSHTSSQILESLQMRIEAYPPTGEPELVWIDGCDGSGNFWTGKYEVTIAEFANFIEETKYVTTAEKRGSSYIWDSSKKDWVEKNGVSWRCDERGNERLRKDYARYPVIHVSYLDAVKYCAWLSAKYNKHYLLPGSEEWIVIASEVNTCWGIRALPGKYQYSGSDRIDDVGWCNWNSNYTVHPIGQKRMNDYFIHDMSGNVYEWFGDMYVEENGKYRPISENEVVRGKKYACQGIGGSCFEVPQPITSANEWSIKTWDTETTGANVGFRVIMWIDESNGESWKNWHATK